MHRECLRNDLAIPDHKDVDAHRCDAWDFPEQVNHFTNDVLANDFQLLHELIGQEGQHEVSEVSFQCCLALDWPLRVKFTTSSL